MNTRDFFYELPEELIAQTPLQRRDASRMMIVSRTEAGIEHKHFYDLPDYLAKGDCIVMNNSRVIPARLIGTRKDTGAPIELLLLRDLGECTWECIVRPGKKCRTGAEFTFGDGELQARVISQQSDGNRRVQFQFHGIFLEILEKLGQTPLPPYIKEQLADPERYQTIYAKVNGSAAAPTAGLHFTEEVFERLRAKGVETAFVTLHVGLGTFRPVKVESIEEHHMHSEYFEFSEETAQQLNRVREKGGKIWAIGTTSCRTLETVSDDEGRFHARSGFTDIFIYPSYVFHGIDGLLTNFHLPESTLLMLVSALAGREKILAAYAEAVKERYRFFSFGDAMLIR